LHVCYPGLVAFGAYTLGYRVARLQRFFTNDSER